MPDGRAIVYATGGDQRRLYRRSLDQPEAVPLAGTEGAANPFVSPDGRWIGFWADGALRRIPAAGGAVQVLHDLRAAPDADGVAMGWGSELGGVNDVVYGATWLPRDTIVFGRFSGGLRAIPADGGTPYALTQPDSGDFAHRLPRALPGGRAVLFTVVQSLTADHTHIEALVLATGERRRLIDDAADARYDASGHLLFARAGAVFAVRFDPSSLEVRGEPSRILPDVMHAVAGNSPGSASGAAQFDVAPDGTLAYLTGGAVPLFTSQLIWIERGGRVDPIDVEPLSYLSPRLSPDGRHVIVAARLPGAANALRLIDVERGTSTVLTRGALFALWMPDGSSLVSAFRGEGGQNIYSIRLDGGGDPELLVGSRHPLWPSSISADGRWLAFVESNPATGNDIWVMDLESGGPARPLLRTAANEMHPGISPDGRWLVYSSDEGGGIEVFVRPFDGSGLPVQVSRNGGEAPSWAPDGRTIYYVVPDRSSVLATAVETTNGLRVGRTEIFATGRLAATTPVGGIDVSTDGRRLLMTGRLDTEAAAPGLPAPPPVPFQIIINARSMLTR
jgi:serine/threonine-protein kinase